MFSHHDDVPQSLTIILPGEGGRANINKMLKFNYRDNIADKT